MQWLAERRAECHSVAVKPYCVIGSVRAHLWLCSATIRAMKSLWRPRSLKFDRYPSSDGSDQLRSDLHWISLYFDNPYKILCLSVCPSVALSVHRSHNGWAVRLLPLIESRLWLRLISKILNTIVISNALKSCPVPAVHSAIQRSNHLFVFSSFPSFLSLFVKQSRISRTVCLTVYLSHESLWILSTFS